jgi:hypothetical protein
MKEISPLVNKNLLNLTISQSEILETKSYLHKKSKDCLT